MPSWIARLLRRRGPDPTVRCVVCRRPFPREEGIYVPGAGLACSQECADEGIVSFAW